MIRHLYILWFQGFDRAPEIVKACLQSWINYNPEWTIHQLSNENLHEYVSLEEYGVYPNDEILPCHLSDIIRSLLLCNYGGVWVDATTLCCRPLSEWLPDVIHQGFFAFDRLHSYRIMSNWFLYAEPGNYIMDVWCDSTLDYYRKNQKSGDYYIHHNLFRYYYESDLKFQQIWDSIPKRISYEPYALQALLMEPMDQHVMQMMQEQPVFKFTHKMDYRGYSNNSVFAYLVSSNSFSSQSNNDAMIEGFETPWWAWSFNWTGWTGLTGETFLEVALVLLTCFVLAAAFLSQALSTDLFASNKGVMQGGGGGKRRKRPSS